MLIMFIFMQRSRRTSGNKMRMKNWRKQLSKRASMVITNLISLISPIGLTHQYIHLKESKTPTKYINNRLLTYIVI